MRQSMPLPVWLTAFVLFAALIAAPNAHVTHASSSGIVISAVYGGGGGTSKSDWRYDYVELFNAGSEPVNLKGWSVQYAAATQTTWNNWTYLPNIKLLPGQYFLIQEATDSDYGALLPAPDLINVSNPQNPHHLGSVSHKVALFSTTARYVDGANPAGSPYLVDLIGYGSSNAYEGSGPAPSINTEKQAVRKNQGCTDTNSNASDFEAVDQFKPRNSSSRLQPCGTATQLLRNSDFNGDANGDRVPDKWIVQDRTNDNVVCNSSEKRVAFAGKCSFKFKGGAGESAVLRQKVNIKNQTFGSGDQLVLSAYLKAKNSAAKIRFILKVKYEGVSTPAKVSHNVGVVGPYSHITIPTLTLDGRTVKKIIVLFKHKSTAGKLWLDGATLMLHKSGSRDASGGELLPVPPAADTSNSGN